VQSTETPATSDVDEEPTKKPVAKSRALGKRKRAASSDLDGSDTEDAPVNQSAAKRKAAGNNKAYVELPYVAKDRKGKGKAKASFLSLGRLKSNFRTQSAGIASPAHLQ
jgi:hypothetical protein